ncbi:MAG: glutaredoxin [Gammaproteobacteria bacterium]|jgi:glutaredoxin
MKKTNRDGFTKRFLMQNQYADTIEYYKDKSPTTILLHLTCFFIFIVMVVMFARYEDEVLEKLNIEKYKPYISGGSSEIVMYSLTTCGYCTKKRKVFDDNHIKYTEYFVDRDRNKENEMIEKLKASGIKSNHYTVPVFDVYGYMMPGNPSFKTINRYIDKHKPVVDKNTGLSEYKG